MNKAYSKMIVFVLIMGTTAGAMLVGGDLLTRAQIQQNQINLKQRTILQSHDYDLSSVTDLANYYDDKIEVLKTYPLISIETAKVMTSRLHLISDLDQGFGDQSLVTSP